MTARKLLITIVYGLCEALFFAKPVEETWSNSSTSAYARASSKGLSVTINDELRISNMKSGLFGWSPTNLGRITMYTGDSRGNGDLYTSTDFMWVSAHEFGHTLGVGDAYNSKNSTGVTSIFNDFGTGVQPEDMTKVLNAWRTKSWQKWE